MRDQTHEQFIEEWADFVREHPKKWKKLHTEFINAQFQQNQNILKKLPRETIIEIYNIKNLKGYTNLLNKKRF